MGIMEIWREMKKRRVGKYDKTRKQKKIEKCERNGKI